jgi:uncharacterized protein YbcV (DUF1398 family)
MDALIEKLQTAQKRAMENRPKIGGFPYMAETLRQAGVKRNTWTLPVCQSVYCMEEGVVVQQGKSMAEGMVKVSVFDETALVRAIRTDQAGESTFPEFLQSAWNAGVLWYDVNFEKRTVVYGGAQGETYTESYPEVTL